MSETQATCSAADLAAADARYRRTLTELDRVIVQAATWRGRYALLALVVTDGHAHGRDCRTIVAELLEMVAAFQAEGARA